MGCSFSRLISAVTLVFVVLCAAQPGAEAAPKTAPKVAPKKAQTAFDVRLTGIGTSKIGVIKVVREATGLGLAEAKGLVESAPTLIKQGLNKADAEALQKRLVSAGATAELLPAGASMAGAAPAPTTAPTATPKKGQKEFTVRLIRVGASQIAVVKAIREVTGLGLKEAKDLMDGAPSVIKQGLGKDDAEAVAKALVGAGATVEIQ